MTSHDTMTKKPMPLSWSSVFWHTWALTFPTILLTSFVALSLFYDMSFVEALDIDREGRAARVIVGNYAVTALFVVPYAVFVHRTARFDHPSQVWLALGPLVGLCCISIIIAFSTARRALAYQT